MRNKTNKRVPRSKKYTFKIEGTHEEMQFLSDLFGASNQILFMDSPSSHRRRKQFYAWFRGEVEDFLDEIEEVDGV